MAVAPALLTLLRQINDQWPGRSKASDGTLPSAAHSAANPTSDHETGNALDITRDTSSGPDLEELAAVLLADPRTKYVIFDRRIANPSIEAGAWRAYSGASPHTHHLHLSVRDDGRDDPSPWALDDAGEAGEPAGGSPAQVAGVGAVLLGLGVGAAILGLFAYAVSRTPVPLASPLRF